MGGICTGRGRGETTGWGAGDGVERQAAAHVSVRQAAREVIERRERCMSAERKVLRLRRRSSSSYTTLNLHPDERSGNRLSLVWADDRDIEPDRPPVA